jgi:beta-glucosidase
MSNRSLIATLLSLALAGPAASAADPQAAAKAEALLRKMTLAEKIGQLSQIGGLAFLADSVPVEERIRKGQAGSILWVSTPAAINKLQKIAMEETRLRIPLIFGLDVIHGFRTIFPMPLALAASWDMQLIEDVQHAAAREARASGIQWTFAPMVDIARDVRWGRLIEGAGEDPFLGSAVAAAQVRGFQGPDFSAQDRLLACAKHFAAYGAGDGGRDYDSAYVPEEQMWNVYLPPFEAAKKSGVGTFMAAYMDLNDVPATGNPWLLRTVLRDTWKFDGLVVSDANSVRDLKTHGFARDAADAAYKAFSAGVNMDMASKTYLEQLPALVQSGKVTEKSIDAMVRPILVAKYRLGLFEKPYADEALARQVIGSAEQRTVARRAAAASAVLLRNEGALLPLKKESARTVAVIGPLGDSKRDLLTMWSGFDLDPSSTVTITEGLRNKLGNSAKVTFAQGVEIRKTYPSMFDKMFGGKPAEPWSEARAQAEFEQAVNLAKSSDVIVMALGELSMMSGELAVQSSLDLPGRQQQLLEAVVATRKPVVLVLVNGRPLNVTWAAAHVPAILEAWHPGMEGGNAIADLLFGDAAPAGKLPITWPRTAGQLPLYYAHNLTHQPDSEPGFESRFWDELSSPLYPFGYGRSYTTFEFSNLKPKAEQVKLGTPVEVTVDVRNTGSSRGAEVAQLYIHQQAGSASRPVRQLKGFQRILLNPGETRTLTFRLTADELRYWSGAAKGWVVEPEKFDVWAGSDSSAALHASFQLVK